MAEPDLWYFAYGSNLLKARKEMRTGPIQQSHIARLPDYRLVFNKLAKDGSQVYANIEPRPGFAVWGVIYLCDPDTLARLDRFEGAPDHYARAEVTVLRSPDQAVGAVVYIAQPAYICEARKPEAAYLNKLLTGAREHGLPAEYIELIQKTAETPAPDGDPK
jgi:gamma-glutamylcyclotransferase